MAKTLAQLQTNVRHNANDNALDISTSGSIGLETVNRIYRNLAFSLPWAEFRQSTDLLTIAEKGEYSMPVSPVFGDITLVEVEALELSVPVFGEAVFGDATFTATDYVFNQILPPRDEWTWSESGKKSSERLPDYYIKKHGGEGIVLEFRPKFSESGRVIRVTGLIEPEELTASTDRTAFFQKAADDALEHLIAADWLGHDGNAEQEKRQLQKAQSILQRLFGKELVPEELIRSIV